MIEYSVIFNKLNLFMEIGNIYYKYKYAKKYKVIIK